MKKTLKPFAALVMLSMLLAPFTGVVAQQGPSTIILSDNSMSPQTLTVPAGTTVVWTNSGSVANGIATSDGAISSGLINPGATYNYTFSTPGSYNYYSSLNPNTPGTITVVGQEDASGQYYNHSYTGLQQEGSLADGIAQMFGHRGGGGNRSLTATVAPSGGQGWPGTGTIVINRITPVQTTGISDGTFTNGWRWVFDITVPANESNLMMKFNDWLAANHTVLSGGYHIPAANNIRFYSPQSPNASTPASAIYLEASSTYSDPMFLSGGIGSDPTGRRVQITVETRIPYGVRPGTYATDFGVRTQ